MWHVMFRSWNPDLTAEAEKFLKMESFAETEDDFKDTSTEDTRRPVEFRVHGNPHVHTGQLAWHESANILGSQVPAWKGEGMEDYFKMMSDCYAKTEGQYIIDTDDPDLLELGEEGVHKRFTSWMGEFFDYAPEDPEWSDELVNAVEKYTDNSFLCNLESGYQSASGLLVGYFRHKRGMPYEWFGAPID